jgi:hypothetical protein
MTTTTASAVVVPAGPVFSEPERLALAGFLAGHSGLTREAYALDMRQFATWCHRRGLALFAARLPACRKPRCTPTSRDWRQARLFGIATPVAAPAGASTW